jgi:hypothetical protein
MTFAGACASRRWRGCLSALVLAAACGGDPPARVDAAVSVLQGAGQADTIETRLPVGMVRLVFMSRRDQRSPTVQSNP